ncbi:MAG: hypothetical protein ONA90_03475, partial [candidate division KSB1 bacterium]|nr:hypothetical protein [candidate division KSB1 bacterium]
GGPAVMKTKVSIWVAALAVSAWLLSGCYTHLARPDSESEPQLSHDSATEEEATEYSYAEETSRSRHTTNVYVYSGPYWPYWDPWWSYPPRSRFYVSIGFGYYDVWRWCGSPWDRWYDPWCRYGYYYAYPWPYHYWAGYPVYYPTYRPPTAVVNNQKRDFTRRGTKPAQNDLPTPAAVTNTPSDRNSLTKPVSSTFARGEDGAYRRVRRDAASPSVRGNTTTTTNSQKPSGNTRSSVRRSSKPPLNENTGSVSRPSGSSGSSPRGSITPPTKPSGSGSAPKSSGSSSNSSGSSSGRRTKN